MSNILHGLCSSWMPLILLYCKPLLTGACMKSQTRVAGPQSNGLSPMENTVSFAAARRLALSCGFHRAPSISQLGLARLTGQYSSSGSRYNLVWMRCRAYESLPVPAAAKGATAATGRLEQDRCGHNDSWGFKVVIDSTQLRSSTAHNFAHS